MQHEENGCGKVMAIFRNHGGKKATQKFRNLLTKPDR